jgi:hypothetical protein
MSLNENKTSILYINGVNNPKITSVTLNEKTNTLEVIKRQSPDFVYGNGLVPPDAVWKEIYGVADGKITLIEKIQGKHIPAEKVPEQIIFEK